ncbi:MAG: LapA family protein, partial [Pseudomonadota bacterium]
MKKLLFRLIWAPVGLVLVFFLVSNRHPVAVSLDPFNPAAPTIGTPALPLWIWLVSMLLIGYFLGAAAAWVSGRRVRKQAKAEHRELVVLPREPARAPQKP